MTNTFRKESQCPQVIFFGEKGKDSVKAKDLVEWIHVGFADNELTKTKK